MPLMQHATFNCLDCNDRLAPGWALFCEHCFSLGQAEGRWAEAPAFTDMDWGPQAPTRSA